MTPPSKAFVKMLSGRLKNRKTPPSKIPPAKVLSDYVKEVCDTTALSIVTMETTGQASGLEKKSYNPSLIVGCTSIPVAAGRDHQLPALIVYSIKPNTAGKTMYLPPSKPAISPDTDSLYDLVLLDQQSLDFPSPIPVVSLSDHKGSHESCKSSSQVGTPSLVTCVFLDEFKTDPYVALKVRQIVPLENSIAVNLSIEKNDIETNCYGGLILYRLSDHDNVQITLDTTSSSILKFSSYNQCIIDLSSFTHPGGGASTLLAAVTIGGCLKIYGKDLIELISFEDPQQKFLHCIYCDGLDQLAAVTDSGYVNMLNIEDKKAPDMPHPPIGMVIMIYLIN